MLVIDDEQRHREITKQTAARLGWNVDKDGFLIHPLEDEEEAQKIWNEEYEITRKEIYG